MDTSQRVTLAVVVALIGTLGACSSGSAVGRSTSTNPHVDVPRLVHDLKSYGVDISEAPDRYIQDKRAEYCHADSARYAQIMSKFAHDPDFLGTIKVIVKDVCPDQAAEWKSARQMVSAGS